MSLSTISPSPFGDALPPGLPLAGLGRLFPRRRPLALLASALFCGVVGWGLPVAVAELPVIELHPPALTPRLLLAAGAGSGLELVAPSAKLPKPPTVLAHRPVESARPLPVSLPKLTAALLGEASYYASKFEGRRTASGEAYRGHELTAAHRTLPFGTRVKVVNLRNGRSVVVRINDRGPFHARRVVDLSRAAARRIGIIDRGRAKVRLEVVSKL